MAADAFRASRWAQRVSARDDLPDTAKLVAWALSVHADNETGECFPGRARLATQIAKTERSITRALGQLRRAGLLEVAHAERQHRPPTYRLVTDSTDAVVPPNRTTVDAPVEPEASRVDTPGAQDGQLRRPNYSELLPPPLGDQVGPVLDVLADLARRNGAPQPDPHKVAAAMADFPDRDHVAVAREYLRWQAEEAWSPQRRIVDGFRAQLARKPDRDDWLAGVRL